MPRSLWQPIIAALALMFAFGAQAEDRIELKVTTYVPPTHGFVVDVLEPWVRELEKRTGGTLSGRVFAGNSPFGKTENQADQVRQGVTDVGWGLNGIPRGRLPRSSIMELPFVAPTADAASRAMWAMLPGMLAEDYRGFKVLALHCHNPGLFHTRDRKLETIFDVKGLRMRAPNPPTQELLQYLGAAPVGMPPGQVYENLEKGVIDGTVFPWDAIKGFRLEGLLKYHLDARVYTSCFHLVMREDRYKALPAGAQKAIADTTGLNMVNKFGAWWARWDQAGLDAAKARGNLIVPVANATREKWRAQLKPVIEQELAALEKSGIANARQIYNEMLKQVARK